MSKLIYCVTTIKAGGHAPYPLQMSSIWSSFYRSASAWIREGYAAHSEIRFKKLLPNIAQKWKAILYKK